MQGEEWENSINPITWNSKPLPLIQVNPPNLMDTNSLIEIAYGNGVLTNSGVLQQEASRILSSHVYSKYEGILVSSNTSGLIAALLAVNVRNKHVVISNFTFAATLHAVIMAGGIPVLCDILEETLEIDPNKLKLILQDKNYKVAVVMPTRSFGFLNDFSEIIETSENFGIPVIVDAAATFPAFENTWNFRKKALSEVFSFHATKVFGIGEGGLIVGDPEFVGRIKKTINFGLETSTATEFCDGLNGKADEFTAARALVRFKSYKRDVLKRHEFVQLYKDLLQNFSCVKPLKDNINTVYSYFPFVFDREDILLKTMKVIEPSIITRRYYYPTIKSGYKGNAKLINNQNLDVSEAISKRILCMPVYNSYEIGLPEKLSNFLLLALRGLL